MSLSNIYDNYLVEPLAATFAMAPVYRGFLAKSALQKGERIARMNFVSSLNKGMKAAPLIGVTVGLQLQAQRLIEAQFEGFEVQQQLKTLASCFCVGVISTPCLAAFNGLTLSRGMLASIRLLTMKETAAIIARETSFVLPLTLSPILTQKVQKKFGKNIALECATVYTTAAAGSLIGHPADTLLTLWQSGKRVEHMRDLLRGSMVKSRTVGTFALLYHIAIIHLKKQ